MKRKILIIITSILALTVVLTSIFVIGCPQEKSNNKDEANSKENIDNTANNNEDNNNDNNDNDSSTNDQNKDEVEVEIDVNNSENNIIEDQLENNNITNQNTNNNQSSEKPINNENSDNQNSASNNSNPSTNNTNNSSSKSETPLEEPIIIETAEMINDKKRKSLEDKFGIKIFYGDEIGSYRPKNLTPTKMTNPETINYYLNEIDATLSTYPTDFFRDFVNEGMPLNLYLIENIEYNSFAGFFDREFFNDLKLTMTATYFFRRTLNHELMHYIDAYLEIVMYPDNPYDEWMTLNPDGYVYGSNIEEYNYHILNKPKGAYFLEAYGQVHEIEDRATIFEDMATRAYKPSNSYYDEGEPIRKKAELIAKQIETYFPSVSPDTVEYWERFIK